MDYEGCGAGPDTYDDYGVTPPRARRRPWWESLLLGFTIPFVVGGTALLLWIVFRAVAGWPLGVPLLTRLAG